MPDVLARSIGQLPSRLRRSLTWGLKREHQPLLRQYFPKRTDLNRFSQEELDAVAAELDERPERRSAGRPRPSGLAEVLAQPPAQR